MVPALSIAKVEEEPNPLEPATLERRLVVAPYALLGSRKFLGMVPVCPCHSTGKQFSEPGQALVEAQR